VNAGVLEFSRDPSRGVLAFDIETTGLSMARDRITCVSAYDYSRGVRFCVSTPRGERVEAFLDLLDSAPLLCAFNGVRFDVPFIAAQWAVEPSRVAAWVLKLVDPYEIARLALGKTFSLNALLKANGMEFKTGKGCEAVTWAKTGQWQRLEEYCLSDTIKTHDLVSSGTWKLPVQT
jgi:DNA polymerase III alpha subunit (gram-positive type)